MQENYEYVQKGIRILHPLLAGFVAMEINKKHKGNWWNEVLSALPERENELPHSGSYAELVDSLDIANALRLIQRKEMEIFRASLGIDGITLSRELMGIRNKVAHIGQQDISRIDAAFYYAFATGSWNITEYKPIYYGLWLFQKLGAECTERLNVDGNINGDIKVLAGKTPLGKTRLLISLVETDSYEFNVKLDTNTVLLRSITTEFNEKDCTDGKTISAENGLFKFKHEGGSGVYLIEY
jgi:hypothetical protein